MSRQRLYGGLIALGLFLTCRWCIASDPNASTQLEPINPALSGADLSSPGQPATPAYIALPADTGNSSGGVDAGTNKRFYTISASLREVYDDNVNTSNANPESSFETVLSPSILVSFPSNDNTFTARYTFGVTYYSNYSQYGGSSSNGNQASIQTTHDFIAQYQHSFSERFDLNLADEARYFTEPSLYENTGTPFTNGAYISNSFNGTLSAQWTPLWGTTTSYSNTIINYEDQAVGQLQNNDENTVSQSVSYALLPKVNVSFGGIYDNITYDDTLRGYSNYTLFVGANWQALPSLSLSIRGGGSYIQANDNVDSVAPYGALTLAWQLGQRSSLNLSYSHEVSPTSQVGANAQTIDRITSSFSYAINPRLSTHLLGAFQEEDIPTGLLVANSSPVSIKESYYYVDTGFTYSFDKYVNFNAGLTASANSSDQIDRKYTREQLYLGVQGTY